MWRRPQALPAMAAIRAAEGGAVADWLEPGEPGEPGEEDSRAIASSVRDELGPLVVVAEHL